LKPALANSSSRPYLEKPFTKIGLVEWLKVKALSSRPLPQKKKEEEEKSQCGGYYKKKISRQVKKVQ
jgi:hypothetical protein